MAFIRPDADAAGVVDLESEVRDDVAVDCEGGVCLWFDLHWRSGGEVDVDVRYSPRYTARDGRSYVSSCIFELRENTYPDPGGVPTSRPSAVPTSADISRGIRDPTVHVIGGRNGAVPVVLEVVDVIEDVGLAGFAHADGAIVRVAGVAFDVALGICEDEGG